MRFLYCFCSYTRFTKHSEMNEFTFDCPFWINGMQSVFRMWLKLTYNSCFHICCNYLGLLGHLCKPHRSRRSDSLHPSKPARRETVLVWHMWTTVIPLLHWLCCTCHSSSSGECSIYALLLCHINYSIEHAPTYRTNLWVYESMRAWKQH